MNAVPPNVLAGKEPDYVKGREYGRPSATYDRELVETDRGTPMGELLRRYWQPFALSSEINSDLPLAIRVMGEDSWALH